MSTKRLGEYEILEQLGEGGMGAVFRARHERLGREVALKVLRPGVVVSQEHERRFQREMTLAAGLSHPNLVKILDGGAIDGTAFIAMELVDGLTVTTIAHQWAPLPWPVALAIASRVADGLAYLHERSILHRDVKPSNILLSRDGYVKLLDFGLARGHGATVMTQEGAVVGTLQYLSPEVLIGEDASERTDMWAAGVVLYLMLTGRMHVMADEFNDWVQAIVNDPIMPPGSVETSVPAPVSQLVTRLLARDPAQRPPTASVLRDELERLLEELAQTSADRVLVPGLLAVLETGTYQSPTPPRSHTSVFESPSRTPARVPTDRQARSGANGLPADATTSASQRHPRPARSRPGTRGSAPVPVAPPRPRNPLLLAVPVLLVSTLFSLLLLRPGAPRPPGPTSSVTASPATSPAASMAELDLAVKSGFARHLVPYLVRLRQGGPTARRNVEELRNLSPIDLGSSADNWIHWIEFEQWIGRGGTGRLPVYPSAQAGPLTYIEERMALSWLSKLGSSVTPQLIATAYRGVGGRPDDGRCWLALGRVFEMEGRKDEAVICYRRGLERLEGIELASSNELIWTGIARALDVIPGYNLERDWFRYLPRMECRRAWVGLKDAIAYSDPGRLERIIKVGLTQPLHRDMATVLLGQVLVEVNADPVQARRIWYQALDAQPDPRASRELLSAMFIYLCERGHVDDARTLQRRAARPFWTPVIDYLGGESRALKWREHTTDAITRTLHLRLEVFRQLELGAVTDAESLAEVFKSDGRADSRPLTRLLLELMGQGTTRPWVESIVARPLARDPPDLLLWNDAAGALANPAGLRIMNGLLSPPGQQPEGWRELVRALWFSRRGKHAQALEALQSACDRYGTSSMPPVEFCEVVARPLLDDRAGPRLEAQVVERARAFPVPAPCVKTVVAPYLKALREGRLDLAGGLARKLFEINPQYLFWALAWHLHARIAGRAEEASLVRARLAAAARWRGCGLWAIAAASR